MELWFVTPYFFDLEFNKEAFHAKQ